VAKIFMGLLKNDYIIVNGFFRKKYTKKEKAV